MSYELHESGVTSDRLARTGTITDQDNNGTILMKTAEQERVASLNVPSQGIDWVVGVWLLFIAYSIFLLYSPNILSYEWPRDDVHLTAFYEPKGTSKEDLEYSQRFYWESTENEDWFREDAPLNEIFEQCKEPCGVPDLQALRAFAKYAKYDRAEEFEDAYCKSSYKRSFLDWLMQPSFQYRFDVKENACVLKDRKEIGRKIRARNNNPIVEYWMWALWVAGFIFAFCWARKISVRRDASLYGR